MNPWRKIWRVGQVVRAWSGGFLWSAWYNFVLAIHPAVTRQGWVRVTGPVIWRIHPAGSLVIAAGVRINSGARINAVGGHRRTIISVGKGARLEIGPGTGISSSTIACQKQIVIGANVLIGGNCALYDSDFHSLRAEERRQRPDPGVQSAPLAIENEAFLGTECLLLKGARIGRGAAVGAGSLVTGSVPPEELWVGRPARFVRRLRTESES